MCDQLHLDEENKQIAEEAVCMNHLYDIGGTTGVNEGIKTLSVHV